MALLAAMVLWLTADIFSIASRADSQGQVTATSAKVRSEASTSSASVASAFKDEVVTITGEVQGADGKVWYAVTTSKNVKGYIRSDLVQKIDGSTPPQQTSAPETPAQVTEVNPVSATVTSTTPVRVRSNASTTSQILTTVTDGTVLTVTGQATGADNKLWYHVTFISNNADVTGFVRSDYVKLSGDLNPVTQTPTPEATPEPEQPTPEPVPEKAYDTLQREDGWWLYDTATEAGWNIDKLVSSAKTNADLYEQSQKTVKSQKVVVVILVFLLVAAGAGVAFLIFKMKEMSDSAYFNAVESETLRRRSEAPQGNRQRVMQTVGTEKQSAKPAGATQGQRPAGTPQGQRPAGTAQGQRPTGTAQQGQRPAGTTPQGQRPAGAVQQGQRPAGAVQQGQRPAGTAPQGQRPAGAAQQGQRPAGTAQQGQRPAQKQGWQSKNFMADDEEEFDFEFLNADEDKK